MHIRKKSDTALHNLETLVTHRQHDDLKSSVIKYIKQMIFFQYLSWFRRKNGISTQASI